MTRRPEQRSMNKLNLTRRKFLRLWKAVITDPMPDPDGWLELIVLICLYRQWEIPDNIPLPIQAVYIRHLHDRLNALSAKCK
jgi:hypothetical protein